MSRFLLLAAPLLLAVVLAAPAWGDDWSVENWSELRAGWEGYGVGTSIQTRTTVKTEIPNLPEGVEVPGERITEERTTLMEVTEKEYVLKLETKVGETWQGMEQRVDRKPAGAKTTIEDVGSEAVTVGGTSHPCMKKRVTVVVEGDEPDVTLVWENETHGILKMEAADAAEGMNWQVTNLDVTSVVGGRTLSCREVKMTSQGAGDITMLLSLSVPGRVVRMQGAFNQAGVKTDMVRELIALDTK